MNKLFLIISLLFAPLFADEVEVLSELIDTTRQNLDGQIQAMELLRSFKRARGAFITDADNAQKGSVMVRFGVELLSEIEKQHITHLFPKDFVNELQFFNEMYHQQAKR